MSDIANENKVHNSVGDVIMVQLRRHCGDIQIRQRKVLANGISDFGPWEYIPATKGDETDKQFD